MSATRIDVSGKSPFAREIFRLEPLDLSNRDAQLPPHMLQSLPSVELCSLHVPPLIWGNSTADDDDAHDGGCDVCDEVARF